MGIEKLTSEIAAIHAKMAKMSVLCLASPNGWDDLAFQSVTGTESDSFFHPELSVVLLDLSTGKFSWRASDRRVAPFRTVFDLETDDEKIARAVAAIAAALPLVVSLGETSLAEELGIPRRIIVPAMRQAAEEFGLHLDDVPGYGWVLSDP